MHAQPVGQLADPGSEQLPLSTTDVLVLLEVAFQLIRMLGLAGCDVHTVRSTRYVAIQPLASVGAVVIVTVTPACGFNTLKVRPEIEVVPAGMRPDRSTVPVVDAVPVHVLSNEPIAQVEAAPGNKGAT